MSSEIRMHLYTTRDNIADATFGYSVTAWTKHSSERPEDADIEITVPITSVSDLMKGVYAVRVS